MKKWILRIGLALWLVCSIYTLGVSFLPRSQGPRGFQGLRGRQGIVGKRGDIGLQGEKGDTGATGLWGLRGLQGPQGEKGYSTDLPALYERTSPTVVWVGAKDDCYGGLKWQGSGFLVNGDGLIATAGHVTKDTQVFEVMFSDGSRAKADFVYAEDMDRCDVGFIQIRSADLRKKRPYLDFDTDVEAGESAIILGYPWGPNTTMSITSGIIAAPKHNWWHYLKLSLFVDVASYPGNSGSPVLDMDGEVIGMLVAGPHQNECYSICTPARLVELAMQKALAEIGLRECP